MEKKTQSSVLAENHTKSNSGRHPSMNSYDLAIELRNKIALISNKCNDCLVDDGLLREKQQLKISLSVKEATVGITVVILIAITFSLVNQFGKNLYSIEHNFTSVTFYTWLGMSSYVIIFPVVSFLMILFNGYNFQQCYREAKLLYSEHGIIRTVFLRILLLALLLDSAIITNFYALQFIAPSDMTAIFSSTAGFVYILSIILLKEQFILLRAGAVILSIIGVVLFTAADGFGTITIIGVILAVASSIISAFYRVSVKLIIGDRPLLQVSFLISIIGVLSLFLSWIPVIILSNTGVDINLWSTIPWGTLLVTITFNILNNFFLILGIAVTYPIFVSLGGLFGIPLNSIIDAVTRNLAFTEVKILGTILLIVAFAILLIPTGTAIKISQKFTNFILCKASRDLHDPQDYN
ncbi:putative thiamine transporter SLC35F3 [Trichoplax sp. H2]|nr:putative thiamine transporter SLC35F3 [Trichoplax sp. H2]|eukprot:RDD46702.1 putative thiamine transporter SLC35F3 [Trichoplax sp. H2]